MMQNLLDQSNIKLGKLCLLKDHIGDSTKSRVKYRCPTVITKTLTKNTYRENSLSSEEGRQYATTLHISLIKNDHLPENPDNWDDEEESDKVDENNEMGEIVF